MRENKQSNEQRARFVAIVVAALVNTKQKARIQNKCSLFEHIVASDCAIKELTTETTDGWSSSVHGISRHTTLWNIEHKVPDWWMDELFLAACEENGISFCSKYIRKRFDVNVSDSSGCSGIMKVSNQFPFCFWSIFTQ